MTNEQPAFSYSHSVDTDVPAARIWALYADVTTWPQWDAEAVAVTRDGPFAAGSTGTMTFAGQDPLPYRLVSVDPEREFTDETPVGDLVVRVSHRLDPLPGARLRLTYSAQIHGPAPAAEAAGPMITADFPQTMAALLTLAAAPPRTSGAGGTPGADWIGSAGRSRGAGETSGAGRRPGADWIGSPDGVRDVSGAR